MSRLPVSDVAASVWAKSRRSGSGWLPLWRHLDDSAAVAGRLWDDWLAESVRRQVGQCLPGGAATGRSLVSWLAGVHDVGKATPAFAMQVQALADRMRHRGLEMPKVDPQRGVVLHATAGQLLLRAWLVDAHGWQSWQAEPYAVVVGGHHGVPPTHAELVAARDRVRLLGWGAGQQPWQEVQRELLDRAAQAHGILAQLGELADVPLPQPVQVLLTAIVIVADWIASNDALFPYQTADQPTATRLGAAWSALDLPAPWRAVAEPGPAESLLAARFDLPEGAACRPVQALAVDLARSLTEPGLLVIEAPMGEGKTEAALAAAEVLAARSGAGGCFVALPTRATSDAMFARVLAWLEHLPEAEVGRRAHAVALAHGKARLNEDFQTLVRRGSSSGMALDSGGGYPDLAAHQWLSGRKTSALASFVVGTIDQVLFAGLKARHLALRHLALAGKVVVIDEAHAYDVYMGQYLDRVLEWLGAYRVPTIVLSATLPADRRRAMVEAYDRWRAPGRPPRRRSWRDGQPTAAVDPYAWLSASVGYPVVSGCGAPGEAVAEVTQPAGRSLAVQLGPLADDHSALVATLRDQLSEGGCALVVRNTVARVQDAAAVLAEAFGRDQVAVAHSRFLAPDRAANDRWLRDAFGPSGRSSLVRPRRCIVVASQVAEQSLDIDFDLLVSDLAPVDLLLQRLGRLHRHPRGRPQRLRAARCLVTGVDWQAAPPEPAAGSRRVYGRHALLRSLAVLHGHLNGSGPVVLPGAIAPLVQAAYGDGPLGPSTWQPVMAAARDEFDQQQAAKRERARAFRLGKVGAAGEPVVGWLDAGVGDVDDTAAGRAQVRDTAAESVEVAVVLRRADGTVTTAPWLAKGGGAAIPLEVEPPAWLARTVASCTLGLPIQLCTPEAVEELKRIGSFPAWQRSPYLQGQLVLVLDEAGSARLAGWRLRYDRWSGLVVTKHA